MVDAGRPWTKSPSATVSLWGLCARMEGPTRGRDAEAELSLRSRAQNGEGLLQRACLGVVGEVDAYQRLGVADG